MGTFLKELSRRNVVRTTLAYLAIAWLVVEVASVVLPTFDVAPWVMQALIVIFLSLEILGKMLNVVLRRLFIVQAKQMNFMKLAQPDNLVIRTPFVPLFSGERKAR